MIFTIIKILESFGVKEMNSYHKSIALERGVDE